MKRTFADLLLRKKKAVQKALLLKCHNNFRGNIFARSKFVRPTFTVDNIARPLISFASSAAGKRMKHMGERQRCTSIATPLPFCALIISA
ncbi:MAG TPA: hypothetical protein VFQ43_09665 [Nitrososphaera sp.]|nr:hypothetical protein [Nitrososphaera sp.]